jgi:hypothetical protein
MKVKIFSSDGNSVALAKAVNEFIKDKDVVDIKYTTTFVINKYGDFGVPESGIFVDRAMVMWEPEVNVLYADNEAVGVVEGE